MMPMKILTVCSVENQFIQEYCFVVQHAVKLLTKNTQDVFNMLGHRIKIADKIAKRRFKERHYDFDPNSPLYSADFEEVSLGMLRKTNVPCSRACCGNPRKHGGSAKEKLTIQEQKIIEAFPL